MRYHRVAVHAAEPVAVGRLSEAMIRTVFENVDVDVRSATDLAQLHAAIVRKTHVLHIGRIGRSHHLRFALLSSSLGPAEAVRRLARLIESLPGTAMREWRNAKTREFDVGFSAGVDGEGVWLVPENIIASVAKLNAQIRITIYPAEQVAAETTPNSRLHRT